MQFFIQCKCPPASEQSRYPEEVEIVISACRRAGVSMLPSGHDLFVREVKPEGISRYLLDLQTMQEKPVSVWPSDFLTDDLWLIHVPGDYLFERRTGKKYPIQYFKFWRADAYVNGKPNLPLLLSALRQAEVIYVTTSSNHEAVVLMPDYLGHPERNFTFDSRDIPRSFHSFEEFILKNGLTYRLAAPDFFNEKGAVSPDGRFTARYDGIHLTDTGELIVPGYTSSWWERSYSRKYFDVRGWVYDSRGAIYTKFPQPCLLEGGIPFEDGPFCFYQVRQAVILLKVPERYFEPQTP